MRTITIANLLQKRRHRPAGYLVDVLSRAQEVTDTHYTLADDAYAVLREKYTRPPTEEHANAIPLWAQWERIHRHQPGPETPAFLARVIASLGCGTCADHAVAYIAAHPPDTSSAVAYRQWATDFHSAVNVARGKPAWTVEQSDARWTNPPVRPAQRP